VIGEKRWLDAACVLGAAAMAAPLWVGGYLPLLDLPQHLALATVLARHGDPAWAPGAFFEPQRLELTPYWTHYLALEALARVVSVGTAARVLLTVYVAALPFAARALARALGAAPAAGLLALPLALNANLYYGFIAYCWGVVLLLWALALLVRQLDSPGGGRAAVLAVLAGVLFFTHIQAFAFLGLAALVLALGSGHGRWMRLRRAWPLAPAGVLLFLPWMYLSTTPRPGAERYFAPLDAPHARYEGALARITGFPSAVAGSYQDGSDDWLLAAWGALLAGAFVAERGDRREGTSRRPAALLLVAAVACYAVLPFSIQGQWNIGPRFAWLAALLAPMLVRRARPWLPAAAVALALAGGANAAWHHARFDREARGFDRALRAIPPGARVLGLVHDSRGEVLERWPYLHFEQYALVERGAMAAHSFAANAPLPVRLRPEARVPAPSVWRPDQFRPGEDGGFFDYLLVRDPEGEGGAPDPRFALVFREGAWRVYRRSI
jgi:hypothetical protein